MLARKASFPHKGSDGPVCCARTSRRSHAEVGSFSWSCGVLPNDPCPLVQTSFLAAPFVGAQDGPWPVHERERPPWPLGLGEGQPVSRRVGLIPPSRVLRIVCLAAQWWMSDGSVDGCCLFFAFLPGVLLFFSCTNSCFCFWFLFWLFFFLFLLLLLLLLV